MVALSGTAPVSAGKSGSARRARPASPAPASSTQRTGPIPSSSTISRPAAAPARSASSTAVPTVGWPANGSSRAGVKIRTRARCARAAGGNTNTVSGWLNSRAIACMAPVSSPSESSTTASGLPANRRSVNTSSVTKLRRMTFSLDPIRNEDAARRHELVLRFDQQHLAGAGLRRAAEHAEHRGGGERHCLGVGVRVEVLREEQRGDGIAGAVGDDGQLWHAQPPAPGCIRYHEIEGVGRRVVHGQRGNEYHARPALVHGVERRRQVGHGGGGTSRQVAELELVGRDRVGEREHALLDELRNAAANENAALGVADHRIAAVARGGIGALHPADRVDHGFAGVERAEIAGEHAVAFAEHAALVDALYQQADRRAAEDAAAPGAIAGVIGELHGIDRPDLDADALQRKYRRRVPDMAIGDVRLDGQDIHTSVPIPKFASSCGTLVCELRNRGTLAAY